MLEVLVRKPGKLVTREVHLTEVCGGAHHTSYSGYLRLYVGQLRKKLEDNAGVRVLHEDRNRDGGAAAGPEDFASFAAGLLAGSALVPAQVEHDDGAELCDVSR